MLHDYCHILCYDGSKLALELLSLISILWLKGHRNVNGQSWFRNSDHAKSMIRLTI